ncbi:unnamed protein product [Spirodela intermedia]|uniref:Retrovirus-related Pol polyprotein from transposon TNT 1-94-like beta-barrel domain-containing protein n=1 Tax=Spirodela intermedia TaxID=51605 RepID=A0ABN7EAC7_SPIIN|nr:unnamed protein product [Spirodela intermedia]
MAPSTLSSTVAPSANLAQTNQTDKSSGHLQNWSQSNRGSGNNRGRRGWGNQNWQPRCQLCSQFGHQVFQCRERFNPAFQPQSEHAYNLPVLNLPHIIQPQAYLTTHHNPQPAPVNWYPDSVATHHITPNQGVLHSYTPYQGPDQLQISNGSSMAISSTGTAIIKTHSFPLKLNNILHVPHIRKHLLFVKQFTIDNDVFIEFHATYFLLKGTTEDGLYLLQLHGQPSVFLGAKTDLATWHNRLKSWTSLISHTQK